MKKIDIICNTSPIIGLISIDRLYLLWDLFGSIIIPEAVFNELCADSVNHQDEIKRIKECVNSGKIIIYKVKNADTVKALYGRLHFGELEVIVGAKELGIDFAIIDEHAARKMASEFLIDTIGVLGILSLAKTKGLINLVKPEMDKLISKGYRISDKLYNQILARNNEVNRRGTNMENHTIVTLKKGEGRTIKAGGAWIFDNEIDTITGTFTNGDIVVVHDFDGYPMGRGFINQNSKIRIRMMTRKADQLIDDNFLRMRVQNAWDYRKQVMAGGNDNVSAAGETDTAGEACVAGIGTTGRPDLNCCRVIFGEADFLPGITVDKYADVLVVECLALGMEQFKVKIVELLKEVLAADGINIRGVYERSDANERRKEGLPKVKGFIGAEFDTNVEIVENAVHYMVDVENGQKTGFFLDQKYNRLAMQRICKGKRVLDCFTHMGTFALNAGIAGASEVTGLDISEYAVKQATENAKRNNLSDTVKFRVANVLDELPRLAADGEKYDVVILDPPAFTKSREATKNAIKGYREINMKGLKLVKDGGFLATCSCSHFMTQELLAKTVKEAAKATHKRLRQVEFRTQGPDHPILWDNSANVPESYYLKFFIFQVVEEK